MYTEAADLAQHVEQGTFGNQLHTAVEQGLVTGVQWLPQLLPLQQELDFGRAFAAQLRFDTAQRISQ